MRFNPTEESNSQGGAAASASAPSFGSAEVSSGSSAGTVQAAHHGHQKPDYDKIFNVSFSTRLRLYILPYVHIPIFTTDPMFLVFELKANFSAEETERKDHLCTR